jgi:methylmalonyl-CoA/ethylmalonyl-CoA epimerase
VDTDTPAFPIDTICQIAFTVQDLARSKDFYQHKVGLRHLFDAGAMVFFQCGATRFMIGTSENPKPCQGAIIYFSVPDIQKAHDALRARGVSFFQAPHLVAKMPNHDLWLALFHDPDGNSIGFMSEMPRHAATGSPPV